MALIEKLHNIANAIRSKTNKSGNLTLEQMASEVSGIYSPKAEEVREVTIENNGLNTITPSDGYDVMKSVKLNNNIPVDGLDFSRIYDAERANEINQYYKDAINYSVEVTEKTKGRAIRNSEFSNDGKLVYLILKDCKGIANYAFSSSGIQFVDIEITDNPNNWGISFLFVYTPLAEITIKGIELIPSFQSPFTYCNSLKSAYLSKWKQGDISFLQSSKLSAESIHYLIQNAVNLADGATARTLTLHATAKTNWQNSEYYQQDLAVLQDKGITIA